MRKQNIFGTMLAFALATGAQAAFVINEVDSDTSGVDIAEFVELKGDPNESVAGLVLVFYNGSDVASYYALDLTGTADANGYFVVGNPGVNGVTGAASFPGNTLQNGEDAVALYTGSAASFPEDTAITTSGLIDYVVYESGSKTDADWSDFGSVTVFNEDANGLKDNQSVSRIPDGTGAFEAQTATPGAVNVAPVNPAVSLNVTDVNFGTYNADNTASPSQRTIRITNTGGGSLDVTTFGLQGGSAAAYTISTAPVPSLPASLASGESVELVVQFSNSATIDQTFTGAIEYVTNAATDGSGTISLAAEFVSVQETPAVGSVVINEFAYDPAPPSGSPIQDYNGDGVANSSQDEFLELYNTTASPINIQGWEITTISGSGPSIDTTIVPGGISIPAHGHVVFFGGGTPTGFPANTAYVGIPALGNSGEQVFINDGTKDIDALSFGGEETTTGAPTGVGVISDGGSVGREFDGAATFVEFVFDSVTDGPTPGSQNAAPPLAVDNNDWRMYN